MGKKGGKSEGIVGSNYLLICMVLEMYKNSLRRDCWIQILIDMYGFRDVQE
jgi:hypothetical protein